jgi:hypothetical protein
MRTWVRWLVVMVIAAVLVRLVVDLVRIGPCPECRGALLINPAGELYCTACGYLVPSTRTGRLARWRLNRQHRRRERAAATPAPAPPVAASPPPGAERKPEPVPTG